jgi:hypothetical protein
VWHSIEPVGEEVVQNIDACTPCREDLAHPLDWMGGGQPADGEAMPTEG